MHNQNGRDVTGVLVYLSSETDFVAKSDDFIAMARDIAMHVAWGKPRFLTRDEVPAEELDKEREIISKQAENEGKPAEVIPKIVEGRISKYYEEHVLLDQTFANVDKFEGKVGDMVQEMAVRMGENISIAKFARISVGEE